VSAQVAVYAPNTRSIPAVFSPYVDIQRTYGRYTAGIREVYGRSQRRDKNLTPQQTSCSPGDMALGLERVLKLARVLRRGVLAVGEAAKPEHPRSGL
jgi:hypothetical protein